MAWPLWLLVGVSALILVPLMRRALALGNPLQLELVNRDLREALAQKERLLADFNREHAVAISLQRALLPQALPEIAGVCIHAVYRPATKDLEVGGDWSDAYLLSDSRLALSCGDVAGHGLNAAITMSFVRERVRSASRELERPGSVLHRVNRSFMAEEKNRSLRPFTASSICLPEFCATRLPVTRRRL
jgi:serine phosphatase RsbU (regulator of sigma subunit)